MMYKSSKYRNKRSISYLSWKANNDRLRAVTKLLKEKAGALADITEQVHYIIDNPESFLHSTWTTNQFKVVDYSTIFKRIENYSGVNPEYFSDIFINAGNAYNKLWEKAYPNDGPGMVVSTNLHLKNSFIDASGLTNLYLKFPIRNKSIEQSTEAQQVDFNIILKGFLEKAKNALDRQLSGYRDSVFISTTLDLRGRIRIFLRSLHTPTHDGKDEDSDRIVNKNRCNTYSFTKKNSINGQTYQFKRGGRLCYRQVRK